MGKIMEAAFCVFYLIFTAIIGIKIVRKSKNSREYRLFGIMTLVLVAGDSFHLIPRIIAAIDKTGDYSFSLGIGKLVTSITMTCFYFILYCVFEMHYNYKNNAVKLTMAVLGLIRIALCLFPQNDWTGEAPVIWGVYRNIPFTVMGIIMVALYFKKRADRSYRFLWLAITLSFAFYIPVVLFADLSPMIGMLMLPKTCMYIWMVLMGYSEAKKL